MPWSHQITRCVGGLGIMSVEGLRVRFRALGSTVRIRLHVVSGALGVCPWTDLVLGLELVLGWHGCISFS